MEQRRTAPRFPFCSKGVLITPQRETELRLWDLSRGGAGLLHEEPLLPLGSRALLRTSFYLNHRRVEFEAEVELKYTIIARMTLRSGVAFCGLHLHQQLTLERLFSSRTALFAAD